MENAANDEPNNEPNHAHLDIIAGLCSDADFYHRVGHALPPSMFAHDGVAQTVAFVQAAARRLERPPRSFDEIFGALVSWAGLPTDKRSVAHDEVLAILDVLEDAEDHASSEQAARLRAHEPALVDHVFWKARQAAFKQSARHRRPR